MDTELAHSDTHDFRRHIKIYIAVFVALLVGTLTTVGAWKWGHFSTLTLTIAVALFIAISKASLVACYFMHLISERKLIYGIMTFTAVFFLGLMFLTVWSFGDFPQHTVSH